jgi:DNA-binding transcriptional LysR family regulator
MILSYRELEVFRHVMETGSITAAAQLLRISQPAVSKMLQQAESRIGFPLFTRQRKRLFPTAEARALLPETINAFAALDVVQRLAEELREGRSGTLTIAAIPALANSVVPDAIHGFRRDYPDVAVVVHALPAQQVVNLVADHRADLGAIIGVTGDAGVLATEFGSTALG